MQSSVSSLLVALLARTLVIIASGLAAFAAFSLSQDYLLPEPTSFDVAFGRLEVAIISAFVACLVAGAALAFWQTARFTLGQRIVLSCAALSFIAGATAFMGGAL